jgi:DnaJ like chaperone protein
MSIWGKVLGGAAGFAMGGPLGALIGAVAGHAVDRLRAEPEEADATKRIGFTIGVIVLGAKMAKADGVVTRDEIEAFRQVFHVPAEEQRHVARLFNQARRDAHGYEPYARQIANMLHDNPRELEVLLDCLFHIAKADGHIHPEEIAYVRDVAAIFGFDEHAFQRIREAHIGPDQSDPYHILGVERATSDDDIRAAYRQLSRENHPDRLIAQGLPQEFIEIANEKMATINGAYDQVRKERGLV